jgi:hypothetical protein
MDEADDARAVCGSCIWQRRTCVERLGEVSEEAQLGGPASALEDVLAGAQRRDLLGRKMSMFSIVACESKNAWCGEPLDIRPSECEGTLAEIMGSDPSSALTPRMPHESEDFYDHDDLL